MGHLGDNLVTQRLSLGEGLSFALQEVFTKVLIRICGDVRQELLLIARLCWILAIRKQDSLETMKARCNSSRRQKKNYFYYFF